ncbi:MAG: hypothetical protein OQK75_05390 [Gammaproteobacteria bacterium]|nr:hypothetical protein [Gammaproteobacteria bacterium]MCW8987089.1 hypothetical protein [Gammaproteobacteria bacterium]MCW9032407.1 hypothetical protein [Gammaproteobacteria bacterium]
MANSDNSTGSNNHSSASRVRKTGIALVHEGEVVLPAAGSEAQAEQVTDDSRTAIHYHFPVEIEIIDAPEINMQEIVEEVLSRLNRALDGVQ